MGINFGRFTDKLDIYKLTQTKNSYGEYVRSYAFFKSVWAERSSNKIVQSNSDLYGTGSLVFVMRGVKDLRQEDRILYSGDTYFIKSINRLYKDIYIEVVVAKVDLYES